MDIQNLESQYKSAELVYKQFLQEILNQFTSLLKDENIELGFNLESRVKTFDSIQGKMVRNGLEIERIEDINDLIGIRIICLLKADVIRVRKLIRDNFNIIREEDTEERLSESEFGYSSIHYEVKIKSEWLHLPTFKRYEDLKFEIQLRTASQHIWAAVSHKFQYKREADVPKPLKRSINRISALLETCDNEFERIINERQIYVDSIEVSDYADDAELDVEMLQEILKEYLPTKNKGGNEKYSDLLSDLHFFNVKTKSNFIELISNNIEQAIESDTENVKEYLADELMQASFPSYYLERAESGVFFNHVGLIREMLRTAFGDKEVSEYLRKRHGQSTLT
ncbi:hypothetical protein ECE50_017600 [Chitinophaga sp. Mgbs1]|uniref:Uncharacterized protein n=1 Tax=Chitinophaga solisilvae TaxID=1233460 RepID=A0A3S1DQR4_9BACT|nr:hypothetical protein [Chitinophaga solisilvae]